MGRPSLKVQSAIAALVLSAVTLGTFYVLRNYGPENAIQRFHEAALKDDLREIALVTLQRPDAPSVSYLRRLIRLEAQQNAEPTLRQEERYPDEVIVWITYEIPGRQGAGPTVHWVVEKTQASNWMINADRTVSP